MHANFYGLILRTMYTMQKTLENEPLKDHFHKNLPLVKCMVYIGSAWRPF